MIGRLIDGRYQVRSRIARGGMATVYLATDLRLERRVAIKIMHGHLADESNFKERFVQEARSAARLAHPNVVNVFDQGQDSDMAYLVMEYLPGMTLRDLLKDYGTLTTEQTLDIMDAVLGGLAAAHKAGIVHRDLKPENVLLADDGRIKIGDFGLSRATSANTATGQALLGTIAYLSPELLTRGTADARSDIYAAGIMMYEMLTGAQPYIGDQPMQIAFQHANDQVPRPSAVNPAVPRDLDDLVLWATTRDPEGRPADARVMLEQLRLTEQAMYANQASTTGVQRTVVMPAAFSPQNATAQTQAFRPSDVTSAVTAPTRPPRAALAAQPVDEGFDSPPTPSDALRRSSAVRRRRGFWLAGVIVLLIALAGGTGWYFGVGPGAQVTIPDVSAQTPDAAQASLEKLGLVVTRADQSSVTVPAGSVVATDPTSGTHVAHDAAVTLIISTGPAQLPLPELIGVDQGQAKQALEQAKFVLGGTNSVFNADTAAGTVLDAYSADGVTSLAVDGVTAGVTYSEAQPVFLLVSAGAVPDVAGESVEGATAALQAVGLAAASGDEVYSDTVAEGHVIQGVATTDPVRPGDTISLTISRGPEPVAVPDVVGKKWIDAKPLLEAAGFSLDYNFAADLAPALVTVSAITPNGGTTAPKGSSIKISF
jgi:serine/threonine protein kinase/beta-lactam-binding protein with PASTA domain